MVANPFVSTQISTAPVGAEIGRASCRERV